MSGGGEELVPNAVQSFEFHGPDSLPKLEPFEFQLDEDLSQPYKLLLRLVAKDPSIDESELVGQACTLTLTRGGLVRHFNGIVLDATFSGVALDAMTPQGNLPTGIVDLTIVPAVELLRQRRNSRIFPNLKVPDILKQVLEEALGDYGRAVSVKTTKDYQELEYCTQFDETDFDFVQRLMGTEGIMWYFKQGETAEELVLFDSADKYIELVTMDHGKVPFETHFQAEHVTETVTRFTLDTRLTSTTATVRAFNWSKAATPDETSAQGKDSLKREREWYLGEAPVGLRAPNGDGVYDKTSAEVRAKVIRETVLSRTRIASGDGDVTGLSPGVTFDLDNALRDELNRKYVVIQVSHRGVRPGDTRRGTFNAEVGEVTYSNTFKCVASDVLYRLAIPPRRFVQTMQTATVVGDEDITTDVHRRIKVQFHWARPGNGKDKAIKPSCWVRVAQASAGIGFGCVFIPRKGQEVVITFLEGDPDKPLVIGSVYNAINTPPYVSDEKPRPPSTTRSIIRTRSTPDSDGYNEISFEDTDGHEEFYVQAQKDMNELVKHDHTLTVGNNEVLRVGDDSKGGKTSEGNRKRWVKNDETIEVGGNRKRTVKLDETVHIDGNRREKVKLDERLHVGESRTLNVGKKNVVTVGETYEMTVTGAVTQTFKNSHTCNVTEEQNLSAKAKVEHINETYKLTTDKKFQLSQGETTLVFEDGKVVLKASGAIKVCHDKGVVEISAGGDVEIKGGQQVTIDGGGSKITLKGGKAVFDSAQIEVGT